MVNSIIGNQVSGDIFLGSCTEPQMQWQLTIQSQQRDTHQMRGDGSERANKKDALITQHVFFSTIQSR
jgi:hypothetical protein